MSYTTIAAEVKTILTAVSGIGNVFDRQPFWKDRDGKITLAIKSNRFNLWFARRVRMEGVALTDGGVLRTHFFHITGFYEIDDSANSEATFQALIDGVLDAFDGNVGLNATGEQLEPAMLIEMADFMVGDTLCHGAVIEINALEEVNC